MTAATATASGTAVALADLIALRGHAAAFPLRAGIGWSPGGHGRVRRGMGMDFAEARPYQPGDDARHVDWRQTARHGRLYTKLFQEETDRPVRMVVDLGAGMRFGTRRVFKSVQAARLAAWLAWAAVAAGDRVGGVVWDGTGRHDLAPRGRTAGALAWLTALAEAGAARPGGDAGDLSVLLDRPGFGLHAGGLTVIIADFAGLDDRLEARLTALARRSDLLLLHVYDPFERLPPPGHYRLDDGRRRVDLASEAARHAFGQALLARQAALERLCGRLGAPWLSVSTADDPGEVLVRRLARPGAARGDGGMGRAAAAPRR